MRFYKMGFPLRIVLTCFWGLLLLGLVVELVLHHPRSTWQVFVWSTLGVVQLPTMWADYWIVQEDGIVQHGLFYRRFFAARGLRYAGPVRRSHLRWLLRSAIEVDTADGGGYPRYVGVAERSKFLAALRRIAPPQSEIVG